MMRLTRGRQSAGGDPHLTHSRGDRRVQSAPRAEARSDVGHFHYAITAIVFNPRPAPKRGATRSTRKSCGDLDVSIRTPGRSAERLIHAGVPVAAREVSIRAPRRTGVVQDERDTGFGTARATGFDDCIAGFQSTPRVHVFRKPALEKSVVTKHAPKRVRIPLGSLLLLPGY